MAPRGPQARITAFSQGPVRRLESLHFYRVGGLGASYSHAKMQGSCSATRGACAMILIRAPPTMACGTIRRVVLQNEKQIQKTANTSTATKTAAIAAAATKTSNAATAKNSNSPTSTSVWCWNRKKEQEQLQQQQQQEQRQQQEGRLSQLQPARRRTDTSGLRGDTSETERASGGR